MSGRGRPGELDLGETGNGLRDLNKELRGLVGTIPLVGFAFNTAIKSIERSVHDVAFGTGEDVLKFGTAYGATAFESNALRAATALPMDPFGASRFQQPIEAAFNRLGGITGPIARAGGDVDMETRQQLANLLYDQERRAYWDNYQNDWIQGKFAQRKIERSGIFEGVPGYDMLRRWFGVNTR